MNRYVWTMLASCVLAHGQGMWPWWDSPMARDLNLSDQQQSQIRQAVRESRGRINQLRATLETAEGDLKDLMNDDPVDAKRTSEGIERVVSARAEMGRAVAQMSLKLRQVLTAKQWRELERRQPRPPMPPAPPAPPHGPAPAAPQMPPPPPPAPRP